MDLKLIKQKLQAAQQKPQKQEKIDYSKIFWKPKPGKYQMRIVPSIFDKSNPFREIYLHYGFAKFPIFALTNWGEQDPIVDFAKELRKTKDKEDWQLASKISPKARYFVPVVVRGEEHLGTRLWEIGKGLYLQLLEIADNEDYGDYTNILEGHDFTVNAVKSVVANREVTSCSLMIKPKTSVLTEDKDLLENLLNEQPDILAINERYKQTYDGLKGILQKWLHPDSEESAPEATATVAESEEDEGAGDLPWEKPVGKVDTNSKINSLFND